jgi:hypothetical protein
MTCSSSKTTPNDLYDQYILNDLNDLYQCMTYNRSSSICSLSFFEVVFHFILRSSYLLGQNKVHTENQPPRLPGSALKVSGVWGGVVGWIPTQYLVKLQLQLRLSWAVTLRAS